MEHGKDEIIRLKIEDISDTGEGIGKTSGFTWFVKGTVPGDVAEARVVKVKKTYGFAEALRLVIPSPCRVTPRCPYFEECGGCQLQDMDYESQLKFKESLVKNQLRRIGGIKDAEKPVRPVIGMKDPWRYRNNEQFYPGVDEYGNTIFGFYAGHTHEVIKLDDCPVGIEENFTILNSIINYMDEYQIRPYDQRTGAGLIGRVQIRKAFATGEIMVCIDIHGPASALKAPERLTESLLSLFPEDNGSAHIKSICAHIINGGESAGKKEQKGRERANGTETSGEKGAARTENSEDIAVLYGPGTITDRIEDLRFQISPLSFYQVNPEQTKRLYKTVLDLAGLTGRETVWDLYCGAGTISLFLARQAGQVFGVEIVPQAVKDAQRNAKMNNIENVRFFAGKAEEILPMQYEKNKARADVMVLDPPRRGCARACLDTIIQMRPGRIVYVSCDSATLSRDIKILREGGYELKTVQPIDLFPQSVHIENAALLAIGNQII